MTVGGWISGLVVGAMLATTATAAPPTQEELLKPFGERGKAALFTRHPKRYIRETTISSDEKVASEKDALSSQPLTPYRIIRLDADLDGMVINPTMTFGALPAGTLLYGNLTWDEFDRVLDVVYCTRWPKEPPPGLFKRQLIQCYADTDGDGALDRYALGIHNQIPVRAEPRKPTSMLGMRPAGMDVFGGLPQQKMAKPVGFKDVAFADDPDSKGSVYVHWQFAPGKGRPRDPVEAAAWRYIRISTSLYDDRFDYLNAGTYRIPLDKPVVIELLGGAIEVLGFMPDDRLRYRIVRPMPTQPVVVVNMGCEKNVC